MYVTFDKTRKESKSKVPMMKESKTKMEKSLIGVEVPTRETTDKKEFKACGSSLVRKILQ